MTFIFHPPSFSIVLHFPFPSFSTPAFLSIIFLFRHFPPLLFFFFLSVIFLFRHFPPLLFCPSFSYSVIFHPCFFVHHFPFLHFPFLLFQRPPVATVTTAVTSCS